MKKILSITILIFVLTIWTTVNANAHLFSLNTEINADTLTVTVISNTNFSAFNFRLNYDKEILTPISIRECELIKSGDTITSNINNKSHDEDYASAIWVDLKDTQKNGDIFEISFKINKAVNSTQLKLTCVELVQNSNSVTTISPSEIDIDLTGISVTSPLISKKTDFDKIRYMNDYGNEFRPLEYATRYEVVDALFNLFDFSNINHSLNLTDVDDNHKTKVASFVSTGIISGYPDGTFKGDNTITRAEFVKLLTSAFKFDNVATNENHFTDISDSWAKDYINAFAKSGYAKGYLNPDGTYSFRPENLVTRAECVAFINRIINANGTPSAKNYIDLSDDFWGYNEILKVVK